MNVKHSLRSMRIIALFFLVVFMVLVFSSLSFSLEIGDTEVLNDGISNEFQVKRPIWKRLSILSIGRKVQT